MEKNGFLLAEETVKIVMALIVIAFLVFILVSFYNNSKLNEKLDLSKKTLEDIFQNVKDKNEEIVVFNPNQWYIHSFPETSDGGLIGTMIAGGSTVVYFPNKCKNLGWQKCVCICSSKDPSTCENKGICLKNDLGVKISGSGYIQIENPPMTLINNNGVLSKK